MLLREVHHTFLDLESLLLDSIRGNSNYQQSSSGVVKSLPRRSSAMASRNKPLLLQRGLPSCQHALYIAHAATPSPIYYSN